MHDESGQEKEKADVKEPEELTSNGNDDSSTRNDELFEDKPPIVEFQDPIYELSQSYKLEPKYENLTEQEAAEVQALTSKEQAEYHELTKFHQHQA